MRRKFKALCLFTFFTALITACEGPVDVVEDQTGDDPYSPKPIPKPVAPYIPQTVYGERFQKLMEKQFNALDKMFDAITLYYDEAYIKSLYNGNEALYLEDFSAYFDASKSRTITDHYGNEYTTTLGVELTEAAQLFLGELSLLKPDMGIFTQMDGVVYDGGSLMIPELDMIINTDSMYGILTLDLKKAELSGADMKAFTEDMNAVTENYLAQLAKDGDFVAANNGLLGVNKAIYKTSTPIYGCGNVYYSWGDFGFDNIESEHKAALLEAMTDWENAVNGVGGDIEFINKTNDVFHQALAVIGLTKLRVMISANLPGTTRGLAIWGGLPGRAHLVLNSGLRNISNLQFALYRTSRHELGHVLGLEHEHQRWDRDEYVTVPDKNGNLLDILDGMLNFARIKEFPVISLPILKFKIVTVGSGWFKIYLPVPYFEWIDIELALEIFRLADGYGGFDYNSVMLYNGNGFYMKRDFTGLKYEWSNGIGSSVVQKEESYKAGGDVPDNAKISNKDARTVKQLYESKWWPW